MIDPSKLLFKKMTEEDMSLLFLAGQPLVFNRIDDFENWLFVLNFPLMSKYIILSDVDNSSVTVKFDLPFDIKCLKTSSIKYRYHFADTGSAEGPTIKKMIVDKHYPEARLLIKASRS